MYYHIDKSGLIKDEFLPYGGNELLLIGELNRNAFPQAFIMNSQKIIDEGRITENLVNELITFFKNPSLKITDSLLSQLKINAFIEEDTYVQRILREIIFEKVRIENFREKPSRLSCIYLIEEKDLIPRWHEKLGTSHTNNAIYYLKPTETKEIKFNNGVVIKESIHKADAMLIEIGVEDLKLVEKNANDYWNGVTTTAPIFEILFYGGLSRNDK